MSPATPSARVSRCLVCRSIPRDRSSPFHARVADPNARVNVRWNPVSDEDRRARETRWGLLNGRSLDGSTWTYVLRDTSRGNIEALVRDPFVDDTQGLDRTAFVLSGEPGRLTLTSQLDTVQNATAFLVLRARVAPCRRCSRPVAPSRCGGPDARAVQPRAPRSPPGPRGHAQCGFSESWEHEHPDRGRGSDRDAYFWPGSCLLWRDATVEHSCAPSGLVCSYAARQPRCSF